MSDCCNECDYWEDRADLNIDNEIKDIQLSKVFAKKNLVNKLTNIKAPSLTHKAGRVVSTVKNSSLHGNDNKSDMSKVGTNSSQ